MGVEGQHSWVRLSAEHTSETVDQYDATPELGFDWHYRTDNQIYDTNPVSASLTWKFDTGIVIGAGAMYSKKYDLYRSTVSNTAWYANPKTEVLPYASVGYRANIKRLTVSAEYSLARGGGENIGFAF